MDTVCFEDVRSWAAAFPNTKLVVLGGSLPSQIAKGKGELDMTCVFLRLKTWLTNIFHWCPVKILVESPTCITKADRSRLSKTIGFLPYELDSCGISPCHWPRYWWFNWEVTEKEGVEIYPPSDPQSKNWGKIILTRDFRSKDFLQPGCALAGGTEHRVPTFTAAQPQTQPGFKQTGLDNCSQRDLHYWKEDRCRFPPYVYQFKHGVMHKTRGWRMLQVEEKEAMMFLPVGYTYIHIPLLHQNHQKAEPVRMGWLANYTCW